MNISQMRNELKRRYSKKFAMRVDKMEDDQVFAIYRRIMNDNRAHRSRMSNPPHQINNKTKPERKYTQEPLF